MIEGPVIDASGVIENQKLGKFVVRRVILLSIAVAFLDGFDLNVMAYLAAYLTDDFQLSRIEMGNLFAAGMFGMMLGGMLFGFLGDKFGRRPMIIVAVVLFGLSTLVLALVDSYEQMLAVRVLNGIALGGPLPLCWALTIEYAPKRIRATVVTLVMMGFTIGSSLGAPFTIWLVPLYGWESAFFVGGILTLILAGVLYMTLPESVRFMVGRERDPALIARYLKAIEPTLHVSDEARFILGDEQQTKPNTFKIARLFDGPLKWITPLLWAGYVAGATGIYFKSSWTPLVLELVGFTRTEAATFTSISAIGSAIGGLILMRFTDRKGPIAIAVMALLAVPMLLVVGLLETNAALFLGLNFIAGILVGGAQYGMHSIAGLYYPSVYRANGAGWASSVAKIGSIIGPMAGGLILATQFPVKNIFALLAICPALLALCLIIMARAQRKEQT